MNEPDNQNKSTTPQPHDVVREPKGDSSKIRQRPSKFRFSMRTLFILVTLHCVVLVPLSMKLYQARQQRLAVAEIQKLGGRVHLNQTGTVNQVDLRNTKITDAGLEHLKGLTSLTSLNLDGTQVTDAGLESLNGLTSLKGLSLHRTQITDAGLENLKDLTSLTYLDLRSTQITDAGLEHLKGLTNLYNIILNDTKITDAGLSELKAALPRCNVSNS
ncbi:MAG: hypothetical protein COA78_38045 [Blastopirellula sp.]|nr:MAG: hypothetical protein COA78_38045 [Blastopirellula sp.]